MEKNVISMSTLGNQPNGSRPSGLVRRAIIASAIILVTLLVEAFLITRMGVNLPDFWTIIAAGLALEIIPVLVWVVRPDFITRILGRRVPKDQMAPIHIEVKLPETVPVASNAEKLRADFEAGILNKKNSYRQEESIQLWAKYTGKLDKGYHVIQVSSTSGATIPEGRGWWSDSTTYHNPNGSGRVGRLIVPPPYEYKASQPLTGFPIGEYKIVFEIGQGKLTAGNRLMRQEAFFVVESGAHPTQQPTEMDDFRNGVATEVRSILKMFVDPLRHWDIGYPSWSSKAEQSKAAILGKEDYLVLRSLYDAIEERNMYFTRTGGIDVAEVDPLNLKCIEAFSRAYSEVTWLKIASDTDSLLSKARKNVGLV